jgi:hypothetical protein
MNARITAIRVTLVVLSSIVALSGFGERLNASPSLWPLSGLAGEIGAAIVALGFGFICFVGTWHIWAFIFGWAQEKDAADETARVVQ